MVDAPQDVGPPQGVAPGDEDLRRLIEDLLAMDLDERLETLRRYVELRASVGRAPR